MEPDTTNAIVRLGPFHIDMSAGEIRKSGVRIVLQHQPLQILDLLLRNPGHVVTREQIRVRLWPDGTFVDFDHSINAAVRRLRRALGDIADTPRFIETLPRRGYRLVGLDGGSAARGSTAPAPRERVRVAVLPFCSICGAPAGPDAFTDGLTDETIAQLAHQCAREIGVVSRRAVAPCLDSHTPLHHLRDLLQVDYVVEGCVRRLADRVRITSQLVSVADATHLWADVFEHDGADSFAVQQRVAHAVAAAVATRLGTHVPRAQALGLTA